MEAVKTDQKKNANENDLKLKFYKECWSWYMFRASMEYAFPIPWEYRRQQTN